MTAAMLVALGAAVGAPARLLVDRLARARLGDRWPVGTLAVNLVGSLLLGACAAGAGRHLLLVAGTGFCGALTTYSTFSLEVVGMVVTGRRGAAAAYAVGSLLLGLAMVAVGWELGSGVAG